MRYWLLAISLLFLNLFVQVQSLFATTLPGENRLQISIITCGPGNDLYSVYGHSAVRIVDSTRGTDKVYNYGTFDFSDPDFYWKFTRGKLLYYLNVEGYEGFIRLYQHEGRSVYEQVLDLNAQDATAIQDFLEKNVLPENRYYRYDFLFDNCSTRIRDIFPNLLGNRFSYGMAMQNDSLTFREILDYYERDVHWERMGINILLSNLVDERMSSHEAMFLPDFLQKGFHGAQLDSRPLVKQTIQVVPSAIPFSGQPNSPLRWGWLLLIGIFIASLVKTTRPFLIYFDILLFLILGLLGCFLVFMWVGTEHAVCAFNLNLFWAFPAHLIFAYFLGSNHEKKAAYARVAASMLLVSLFLSWFGPQPFPSEITPILWLIYWRLNAHASRFNLQQIKTWTSAR